jgi:hypothetical protein
MRMPLLQKGIPMTANLPLQHTQLMLRHPTDGGNGAVPQPELRFQPTFPRGAHAAARANPRCKAKKSSPAI